MALELRTLSTDNNNRKDDLLCMMDFDFDFVGYNGGDFTTEDALSSGMTDFEYLYQKCDGETFNYYKFFDTFFEMYPNYYNEWNYVVDIRDGIEIIALAYSTDN